MAHRKVAFLLLVLLSVGSLGGLTGCKAKELVVSVQPDRRLFTLFVGLLAGGYGDRAGQLNPTQDAVLKAIGDLPARDRQTWEAIATASAPDSPAPQYTLTDHVLAGGNAPEFDGLSTDLQAALRSLWTSHVQTLYADTQEAQTALTAPLASTAPATVEQVLTYARLKERPFDSLQVIPNPLAAVGFSRSWLDPTTRTAYVVLGPQGAHCLLTGGDLTLALARETFRLCLDESLFTSLDSAALDSFARTLRLSSQPWFTQDRCATVPDFLRENLARACAPRALGDVYVSLAAEAADRDSGFTLVEAFEAALRDSFETTDESLPRAVGQLVSAVKAQVDSIAAQMSAPEGYPALPEGWQWVLHTNEYSGTRWYEAVGVLGPSPRCPFDGWASNIIHPPALCGLGLASQLSDSGRPLDAVVVWVPDATDWLIPLGIGWPSVSQGNPLPYLAGRSVSIHFLPSVRAEGPERMLEILVWLIGNE